MRIGKRNKFSLSHTKLLTADMGELIPCGLTEVLPGDTMQQATSALIRVSPMVAPVMHPVDVRIHHFFVPHRIIWPEFEQFITGGPDGLDATILPTIDFATPVARGDLSDYLGLPAGSTPKVSALPFRAYNLIWNEFYRDQDTEAEAVIRTQSGGDTVTETDLRHISWQKDYFTSASADTQKGVEVTLPLGTLAPITGLGFTGTAVSPSGATIYETGGVDNVAAKAQDSNIAPTHLRAEQNATTGYPEIYADLSSASAASINELREAFALQRYAEARQRFGSRYAEYLRALGVTPSDARIQRPEYLGGGKQTIQFSEILQTGVDSTDSGLGNLGGHGIGTLRSNRYRKFFEEHGYIVSVLSVRPRAIYSQAVPRHFWRKSKEDFYQKELASIGMQAVQNKEVYADHSFPDATFGYQDRYDEYRSSASEVSGEFGVGGNMTHWHMARIFSGDPALNSSFTSCQPTDRIYADATADQLQIMIAHSIQARRMITRNGQPKGV